MQIRISTDGPGTLAAEALALALFSDKKIEGVVEQWDRELGGQIGDVLAADEISGKRGEIALVRRRDGGVKRVLVVGLGERKDFMLSDLTRFAGTAVRYLGKRGVHKIAFALPAEAAQNPRAAAAFLVEGAIAATMDTTTYRSEQEKVITLEEIVIVDHSGKLDRAALENGAERGRILGEAVNFARTLALTPANDMTPNHLAAKAKEVADRHGLGFEALDEEQMEKRGMGAILGVSRGSAEPARMIVLRYDGDPSSRERVAFVGKGLTFDSGGISIKPAENMHEMKYDMSGGAGVIASMLAIAQLKPRINVLGVVPASENLPGSRAVKPGDVLRAMNGKTIEVINTDAEGRLILADALCYARELGATRLVDCATLTGACVVALGHAASGTMSNDDAFVRQFLELANRTGERYWQLPLYDDFSTAVKSEIADLRNSAGRAAGSETAGAFLKNFVADVPWIHLDIAGTAYVDDPGPHMAKGPTGVPVRALVTLAEELAGARSQTDGAAKAKEPVGAHA
jgi:leucyl aminopeptidase